jgi:hypothetical protein
MHSPLPIEGTAEAECRTPPRALRPAAGLLAVPFVASIASSALLLFLLEPMIGRVLLPEFGGSPAIWNTCLAVFQILLLAGYAWAHWSVAVLGTRGQIIAQIALLAGSLAVLPFSLPAVRSGGSSPTLAISFALLITIGLPFVLLASNSSLVQRWYALSGKRDPFWLYAASNAGSLAGLLGYPLLFEPVFGLTRGWRLWAGGYVLFLAVNGICMAAAWVSRTAPREGRVLVEPQPSWTRRAGWLLRAAVGSSLLLSVTMKITTDLASGPVFWVAPLALYLLTFVVAFSERARVPRRVVAVLTAIGIAWALIVFLYVLPVPLWMNLGMLLGTLFFGALLCHGDLASSRPDPEHLTGFYLWIALGGAIGGALNSFAAPALLDSLAEYPLTLLALAFLLHAPGGYLRHFPRSRMRSAGTWMPPLTVLAVLSITALMILRLRAGADAPEMVASLWQVIPMALVVFGLLLARHAGQFEFVIACLLIFTLSVGRSTQPVLEQTRSFFGVMKVVETPAERILQHGTTVHGAQWRTGPLRHVPTRYYYPAGPFSQELVQGRPGAHIGVVGLGVGALALMAEAGQHITFFEIDHDVETLARRHFTYLADTAADVEVRIGDGRLLLRQVPDGHFDALIIDAFSSDAIPAHLLTREALALYLRKVRPDGVVALHISNRAFDLARVLRGWSRAEGLPVAIFPFEPTEAEQTEGATLTAGAAIARDPLALERLVAGGNWSWLGEGRSVLWTDDRIDLLAVLGPLRF